jgi:hypothetical protein
MEGCNRCFAGSGEGDPAEAMIVPTMVPPLAALIVAELPTCQKTFLACAPLVRITLRGVPGSPTRSALAIWNTQIALESPWPSKVMPAPPPIDPKVAAVPRFGPITLTVVPVMKVHGFGAVPATRDFQPGRLLRS